MSAQQMQARLAEIAQQKSALEVEEAILGLLLLHEKSPERAMKIARAVPAVIEACSR